VCADRRCPAAAVFTQSRFAGPSVQISRDHVSDGYLQAVATISKNSNVANGDAGHRDALELTRLVAGITNVSPKDIAIGSTGIIGSPYPMERLREKIPTLRLSVAPDFAAAARGIMTSDTHPKVCATNIGTSTLTGIAKGIGMIEPNMATLLAYFFTDADIAPDSLDRIFRRVIDRTFNSLSIDTDTSTSDTAVILANGMAGSVELGEFESALYSVSRSLVRMVASDPAIATKLIEVDVSGAGDDHQARRVAKSIVNSPLVKTAVYGSDPNWGRVTMAIGKCNEPDLDPTRVSIRFGDVHVYPNASPDLSALTETMNSAQVRIRVDLHIGDGEWKVWGCDLPPSYINLNSRYSAGRPS
jgi:glutamate N-acetyltransferase / amino-acid N-acetyltransferase